VVIYYIKVLLNIKTNLKFLENRYLFFIFMFLEKYIINSPKNLYEFLYGYLPIKNIIDKTCEFIANKFIINHEISNKNIFKILLFFNYIIKILVAIVFLYDIIYYQRFIHFFTIIPLLILPLIFNISLFMICNMAKKNKKVIEEWLKFDSNENNSDFVISLQKEYENDSDFTDEVIYYHYNYWYNYLVSLMVIEFYYDIESKIKPFVNIFIYSIYTLGWGYILGKIFFLEIF
jgi:ABC-type bacteriocin/lantibiotic exporter with double-glycine peptidase domain